MKKKFFILIFSLAFLALSGYILFINKQRSTNNSTEKKDSEITSLVKKNDKEGELENSEEKKKNPEKESEENANSNKAINITVKSSDCDNECSRFKDDDEQEYCERVCGISDLYVYDEEEEKEADSEEPTDCSKKTGLKKDYCLKDQAIEDEDYEACSEINDSTIKKACQNRITEDILEKQEIQN